MKDLQKAIEEIKAAFQSLRIKNKLPRVWSEELGRHGIDIDDWLEGQLTQLIASREQEIREEADDYEKDKEKVTEAIKNREIIYISLRDTHILTEEQYLDFQDYADSVGMPGGSSVERFLRVDLSQQPREYTEAIDDKFNNPLEQLDNIIDETFKPKEKQ